MVGIKVAERDDGASAQTDGAGDGSCYPGLQPPHMIDYDHHRWLKIVFTFHGSVASRMIGRIGLAAGLGVVAVWAHRTAGVAVPPIAHTLIGVALGLLLVFRTNASYGRYAEARTLLGQLVWASRDLARQLAASVPRDAHGVAARRDISRWTSAYYRLLVQKLRNGDDLPALADRLTPDELAQLAGVRFRVLVVGSWITAKLEALARSKLVSEMILHAMDRNLTAMVQACTGCERIRRTPVPFAYAQHIKVFLVVFCYTVPFVIVDTLHMWTPIASAVLAFALFGIDEIGVEIEDPFGTDPNDLPMDEIGVGVDTMLSELLEPPSLDGHDAPEEVRVAAPAAE